MYSRIVCRLLPEPPSLLLLLIWPEYYRNEVLFNDSSLHTRLYVILFSSQYPCRLWGPFSWGSFPRC
jgi:hypothetical protein